MKLRLLVYWKRVHRTQDTVHYAVHRICVYEIQLTLSSKANGSIKITQQQHQSQYSEHPKFDSYYMQNECYVSLRGTLLRAEIVHPQFIVVSLEAGPNWPIAGVIQLTWSPDGDECMTGDCNILQLYQVPKSSIYNTENMGLLHVRYAYTSMHAVGNKLSVNFPK